MGSCVRYQSQHALSAATKNSPRPSLRIPAAGAWRPITGDPGKWSAGRAVVEGGRIKSDDLDLRPVFHRLTRRVQAHVLIGMLAAYLVWHLRKAWASLTYTDEDPPVQPDPVAPAPLGRRLGKSCPPA